jgi:signal transduction histidine kinase
VQTVLAASRACGQLAAALAERCGRIDPDLAYSAASLANFGWLAACAVRPDAVVACLADGDHARPSEAIQQRCFGTTTAEITRRLSRRWELPAWLSAVIGYLDLPASVAPTFGGDPLLATIVQAAVVFTAQAGTNPLCITVATSVDEALARLGLNAETAAALAAAPAPTVESAGNPYESLHLSDLLELAVENAERRELHFVPRLEAEVDHLHRLLLDQRAGEGERLGTQKLTSLAEFAAGAGHEINNPLAVISGQAQYLLGLENDPDRQRSLRAIVQQTQRVHQILTDLMQFARPARPQKRAVDVRDLVQDAAGSLADLAAQRQVRIDVLLPDEPCVTDGDPRQVTTAVTCLLRNAVEAAPADGWARVRVEVATTDRLRIAVEDSGPGPASGQAEHLFDPFYSGRPAGRGRGLGLPTAWRLAREQGGDVAYEPVPGGPTRFVVSLVRVPILQVATPQAA